MADCPARIMPLSLISSTCTAIFSFHKGINPLRPLPRSLFITEAGTHTRSSTIPQAHASTSGSVAPHPSSIPYLHQSNRYRVLPPSLPPSLPTRTTTYPPPQNKNNVPVPPQAPVRRAPAAEGGRHESVLLREELRLCARQRHDGGGVARRQGPRPQGQGALSQTQTVVFWGRRRGGRVLLISLLLRIANMLFTKSFRGGIGRAG
ncbi:hypothetical protein F4779DRAFT_481451 [Xylariaceae sp. FL0662B]|nr:hypothetical protein F4779DRAFT_481451 [Xylariaceae sp. FL0662B]